MVGLVRASNSECAVDTGLMVKYNVEAARLATTANKKLRRAHYEIYFAELGIAVDT